MELGACANFLIERSESVFSVPEAAKLPKPVHLLETDYLG